jgi:DNA-binding CsgD family transcriptional regulator
MDLVTATVGAGMIGIWRGDIPRTLATAQEALELGGEFGLTVAQPVAIALLIYGLVEHDEADTADRVLADHGFDGELSNDLTSTTLRQWRGYLHAAQGRHEVALQDLFTAGELLGRWRIRSPHGCPWRSLAVRPLLALGRADEASRLAQEEIVLARQWGTRRAIGTALCAAGVADSTCDGTELLHEAVTVLEDSADPLKLALALTELGARLRRQRQPAAAREPLRRALDVAHRCGARAVATRARDELRATGAKPRRERLYGRDALTPRELRVAELATDGLTNREIAQTLFVAQRTVEHHLTSSYTKLGVRTRTQLSAILSEGEQ